MAKNGTRKRKPKEKQELLDPRQISFLQFYTDPGSDTYANAKQSAIKAGFSEAYADNITHLLPQWLSDSIGQEATKALAQRHVDEVLQVPILVPAMGPFGPITRKIPTGKFKKVRKKNKKTGEYEIVDVEIMDEEPVMVYSSSLMDKKSKIAMFALESLDPRYKKDRGPKIGFQFNITPNRDRYAN